MILNFSIHYQADPGQVLYLLGSIPSLGHSNPANALPLKADNRGYWHLTIDLPDMETSQKEISYAYQIRSGNRTLFREVGPQRRLFIPQDAASITLLDQWQGNTEEAVFLTRPFTRVLYPQAAYDLMPPTPKSRVVLLQATLPNCSPEQGQPYVVGEDLRLGSWDPSRALPLLPVGGCRWQVQLPADWTTPLHLTYKFILKQGNIIHWESGENRQCTLPVLADHQILLVDHAATNLPFPRPRLTGTAIPVFSLRREDGFGIGDFTDLKQLVCWAAKTGQHAIQLLPINDTTATWSDRDSYPYSGISVMALHPIYGNPDAIAQDSTWEDEKKRLNQLEQVDYAAVLQLKWNCWRSLAERLGDSVRESAAYQEFVQQHQDWLLPYAAFCTLRDHFQTANFQEWGDDATYSSDLPQRLMKRHPSFAKAMQLHILVQFWLDQQLSEAVTFAHQHKVVIKGDIPIGITPNSVEAWTTPAFFHRQMQAGAPPDAFAENGQNWGFPTYNWQAMANDHYQWWKRRFTRMADHFDLYRIDHILGFFRIWEIPRPETQGLRGHFYPALPYSPEELQQAGLDSSTLQCADLWIQDPWNPALVHPFIHALKTSCYQTLPSEQQRIYHQLYDDFFYRRNDACWEASALEKLPELIAATDLQACAEDLGMIPTCVPDVLQRLRIATLEVQRMPKQPGLSLANPRHYPYRCVCTTGTHDTSTLRGWWKETHPRAKDCPATTCRSILQEHLDSPAMWIILPWQDWVSIDTHLRHSHPDQERINRPDNPHHIWNYRMHCSLEKLLANEKFNNTLKRLTKNCIL